MIVLMIISTFISSDVDICPTPSVLGDEAMMQIILYVISGTLWMIVWMIALLVHGFIRDDGISQGVLGNDCVDDSTFSIRFYQWWWYFSGFSG